MLPWLVSLSFEVNQIDLWRSLKQNAPGQIDYCWTVARGQCLSLTSNQYNHGEGTRTYFRIYEEDDNNPMAWQQLKHNNRVQGKFWENLTEGWRVEFDIHKIEKQGVLEPFYYISNIGKRDFLFDLLIYTPINFGSKNKQAELKLIENGDVVDVDGGDKHMYVHLRKTPWSMHNPSYDYFGNVDKIYMGQALTGNNFDDNVLSSPEKNFTPTSGQESALGFAWYKHTVKKGDNNRFGFKIHPTPNFERLPLIKDVTPVHETYPDPYNLTFNLTSYNNKTVRAGWSREQYREKTWCKETFTPSNGIITGSINCSIPFASGSNISTFYAVAEEINDNGTPSLRGWEMYNSITRYKHGSLRPILNLTTEPNENYNATDSYIFIEGFVDDENYAQLYYKYDTDTTPTKGEKYITSEEFKQLQFHANIPIPSTLPLGSQRTIFIWVEDDQGLASKVYNKTFTYGNAGKPFVRNVYVSDERLIQNSDQIQLVVYGEGVYTADKKTAKVYIQVDNGDVKELGNFTSSNYPEPFAGFYDFKPGIAAHHTVKVYAKEETEGPMPVSDKYATAMIIVWDPFASQPPMNFGKFVDKSANIKSSDHTLFNLHFIDFDAKEWNMTHNDEGFHCKYRTYNTSFSNSHIGEYDLVHNPSSSVTTQDNFEIRFEVITDPTTNFTLAKFNVTNKNYFERKFGLSIVADSELGPVDDEKINYDPLHGKIVVNNTNSNNPYVSYTVFTSEFDDSPAPNMVLTVPAYRKVDDGSFSSSVYWQNQHAKQATVYGMSWTDTVIPGKGYLVYYITFAAYGYVKSPTRLVDNTKWQDTYESNDNADIDISFVEFDGNEQINLKIIENGNDPQLIPWIANSTNTFHRKMNLTKAKNSIYTISIQAFDIDTTTGFPSNKIEKTVYLKEKPVLTLNTPSKMFYSVLDNLDFNGTVSSSSTSTLDIYYRHFLSGTGGKEAPSVERLAKRGVKPNELFSISIKMDEIWPSDDEWKIQIYAKDGELKSNDKNFSFNLNPYNPPTLKKAGLSKKAARLGERLLGYVVVNDKENDKLDIYVSVDNSDISAFTKSEHTVPRNPNAGKDAPFAFYWDVPTTNINTGVHQIYFLVRDSEGIASEVYGPKVLVVTV